MMDTHTIFGQHPTSPFYVSIDGDVYSARYINYLVPWKKYSAHLTHNGSGYPRITARIPSGINHLVHRLVVETFIGPIPTGMQVDHINEIKVDNTLENLQILTASENTLKSARIGELNGRATITLEQAQSIWGSQFKYITKPGFRGVRFC